MTRIPMIYFFLLFAVTAQGQEMNNKNLAEIITEVSDSITGKVGAWEFYISGMPLLCITDERYNRMRMITPVSELSNLKKGQLKACMEANFHSVLDVKYAISGEMIWVVFIHPLKELTEDQLLDAIAQVWNAANTFGTTYNSTDLVFPKKREKNKSKKI